MSFFLKRCVALLGIFILLIVGCLADASDLKWGMTEDEAIEIMGYKGEEREAEYPTDNRILYENVKISDLEMYMLLYFRNNMLVEKMYLMDTATRSSFTFLKGALESKYGKSSDNIQLVIKCLESNR